MLYFIVRNRIGLRLAAGLLTIFLTGAPSWAQNSIQNLGQRPTRTLILPGSCQTLFTPARASGTFAKRSLEQINSLRFMTYNVKNLFTHVGEFNRVGPNAFKKTKDAEEKPLVELHGISRAINESNPDILVMQEVEGLAALQDFSSRFLGNQYRAMLIEGNDPRGIDIGFLVKRDLPFHIKMESYRHMLWKDPADNYQPEPVFSRDLPALLIYRLGETDLQRARPLMVILGNHAKSKRDRPGDPESNLLRSTQYHRARMIIESYFERFGPNLPLIMAGDFNTDVQNSFEVKPVTDRLTDVLDLRGVSTMDRITHTFHPQGRPAERRQIDAILVSPELKDSVTTALVYRYKNAAGVQKPIPATYSDREQNPSDHFPIVVEIKTDSIFTGQVTQPLPAASGY
jgi:endonuclease/exonuclease/phosphatase family metal-dependent hydrolase